MLHDHTQFETDPDAAQALENALPFVEELIAAEKKLRPPPNDFAKRRAAEDLVRDKLDLVQSCANSAHVDVNELLAAAERRLGERRSPVPPAPERVDEYTPLVEAVTTTQVALLTARREFTAAQAKVAAARVAEREARHALKAWCAGRLGDA